MIRFGNGSDGRAHAGSSPRLLHSLVRVRLFYKILLANAAVVLMSLGAVTLFARSGEANAVGAVAGSAALIGAAASIGVNVLLLRLALRPLDGLARAAERVRAGDLAARAPTSQLADPELARLINTFNETLDQLVLHGRRLRTIAARTLDTAEEERRRGARELYDDTAQVLAGVLLRLHGVRRAAGEAQRSRLLDELRSELVAATERTRAFAQGLRPPALDVLGLAPAIEAHARRVAELADLDIEVHAEPVDGLLSGPAELALYRILQEALANAVRHADARRVRITLQREDGRVVATVDDDGRGFDPAAIAADPERGLGLFGMEERASYIGGRAVLRSEPGAGTHVRAEIPIGDAQPVIRHV